MTVSRETRFAAYVDLLRRWGGTFNLTSKRDAGRLDHHIRDSLSVVPHLPPTLDRLVDLGSGQGFPAIPIAIETGVAIDMIEADRRKAAFLTTVMAALHLRGTVWPNRIEHAPVPPAICVTARALADLSTLVRLARPFVAPGGYCLFLKGEQAAAELDEALRHGGVSGQILPASAPPSCLVKITVLS